MIRLTGTLLTAMLLALATGCEPEFNAGGQRVPPGGMSPMDHWSIVSRYGSFTDLDNAIDASPTSAARVEGNYVGAGFTLDLGRRCVFNMVVLSHRGQENGYARRVSVEISNDGKTFRKAWTSLGTRAYTYIPLLTQVSARYVRITATEAGVMPWSISNIYFQ
ncbi:MAG: discoidin domain-containing protein [Phycisphaerales bacterium]|jgi:hypothetical protein|nr:discoidin domain-containing protein [Phycisphaerales bacterium]MBT7170504.1 discoidin domain-containing protein [Phycisphaerales bacterium]